MAVVAVQKRQPLVDPAVEAPAEVAADLPHDVSSLG
jgi:hypothetical protein